MKTVKLTEAEYDVVAEILEEAQHTQEASGWAGGGTYHSCQYCEAEYDSDESSGPLVHDADCLGEAVVAKFSQED